MNRNELTVGQVVESRWGTAFVVLDTRPWKKAEYSYDYTTYTLIDTHYRVFGSQAPRGRYVLLKYTDSNTTHLLKPADLQEPGIYAKQKFARYVVNSNAKAAAIEKRDILLSAIHAFWGDHADTVIKHMALENTAYRSTAYNDAVYLGKLHYSSR